MSFPIALNLTDKACLVVGGGDIAEGKLEALLRSGADVTVVSPEVRHSIDERAHRGELTLRRRPYRREDLAGAFLVIAATDDRAVNAAIAAEARSAGILVNAVDDPPNCDFFAVSIVRRGDLQLAISTNGLSPAFARWMRERLDATLPAEYADLLTVLADVRRTIKAGGPIPPYESWRAALTPDVLAAVRAGDTDLAWRLIRDRVTAGGDPEGVAEGTPSSGLES